MEIKGLKVKFPARKKILTAAEYEGGILFEGKDIQKLSQKEMRHLRGKRIAVIFRDPMLP